MKKLKRGKKSGLKYFGYQDIKEWVPCYDPVKHIPTDWRGTAVDILKIEGVPYNDKLWAVIRQDVISERLVRLFAVWCARQVAHLMPDPVCLKTLDMVEAYANGQATLDQLSAARYAAESAAWSAARYAAWSAASAAESAAWSAQINKLIEMIEAEGKEYIAKKKVRAT